MELMEVDGSDDFPFETGDGCRLFFWGVVGFHRCFRQFHPLAVGNRPWLVVEPTHQKNISQRGISVFPNFRGENKQYLKPPPRPRHLSGQFILNPSPDWEGISCVDSIQ